MRLRHVSRRKVRRMRAPSGAVIDSRQGETIDVLEEDGVWLLTLRARNCRCGNNPRPNANGPAVYEVIE